MLRDLEAVPGVQIQTGQPGTRQTPVDAMQVGQGDSEVLRGGKMEGGGEDSTDVVQDVKAEHKMEFFDRS